MLEQINRFILDTEKIEDEQVLFSYFAEEMKKFGFDSLRYHIMNQNFISKKLAEKPIFHTFPQVWVERYINERLYETDPMIKRARNRFDIFSWAAMEESNTLTPAEKEFVKHNKGYGFKDGLGVPIFGPKGEVAYIGLASKTRNMGMDQVEFSVIHHMCYQMHRRYRKITKLDDDNVPKLSPREKEILQWIAQGKSNSVIADILEISEHTVDSIIRRCFQKLNVSNRISAVLKGLGYGLIKM